MAKKKAKATKESKPEKELKNENGQEVAEEVNLEEVKDDEPTEKSHDEELSEAKDKYLRIYSEFENFRRRTAKERLELMDTASREVMESLLPVLDDFQRAIKAQEDDKIKEGIELIYNKMFKTMTGKGLKAMETKAGDDFDEEFHEAITQIPAPSKKLEGKIVDVIEPGYLLGEKVIRFAKVVTGAKS